MASTVTQPIRAAQDGLSDAASDLRVTASEWFASGSRWPYDPIAKTMLETTDRRDSAQPRDVFEKVVAPRRSPAISVG